MFDMSLISDESHIPLWTAVAAVAAFLTILVGSVFSILSIKLTRDQLRLMRDQASPKVIVFLRLNPEQPTAIYIVIKNVGGDLAEHVQFTSSRPVPSRAFGMPGTAQKTLTVMTDGPLITGIPLLGPK